MEITKINGHMYEILTNGSKRPLNPQEVSCIMQIMMSCDVDEWGFTVK